MGDPTWCYDKEGNATLHYLSAGEGPPSGLSLTMPPGTHPHERELAAIPRETAAEPEMRGAGRPPTALIEPEIKRDPDKPKQVDIEWAEKRLREHDAELAAQIEIKRGPGRPRKTPWPKPDAT